ncbi:uncharacterized protein LOC126367579 [Pectinophora gossypiella]|uniref:uncharacterized protein LOC126367579 n=1 Tax=Pectinophora gossypiella TaxID=13191 RepID=UPI00214E5C5B|nr:uncharacterized protein LOC126367579 [Pectinophora gossypiella]
MSAVMSTLSIISGGRRAHRKLASSARKSGQFSDVGEERARSQQDLRQQRSASLQTLETGGVGNLETLEAKMASIEVSLAGSRRRSAGARDVTREFDALRNALTDKDVLIQSLKKQLSASLSAARLAAQASCPPRSAREEGAPTLSADERRALEDRAASVRADLDARRNNIQELRRRLEKTHVTDNIDTRIQQAELQYKLGREELELLSLGEQARALAQLIEQADAAAKRADTPTLYSTVRECGGTATLVAAEAREGAWGAGVRAAGVLVEWPGDHPALRPGDRLVEVNGTSLVACRSQEELQRAVAAANPARLVLIRGQAQPPLQTFSQNEAASLRSELGALRSAAEEAERAKEGLRCDNTRLTHRISYLEEQVAELLAHHTQLHSVNSNDSSCITVNKTKKNVTNINITSEPQTKPSPKSEVQVFQKGPDITAIVAKLPGLDGAEANLPVMRPRSNASGASSRAAASPRASPAPHHRSHSSHGGEHRAGRMRHSLSHHCIHAAGDYSAETDAAIRMIERNQRHMEKQRLKNERLGRTKGEDFFRSDSEGDVRDSHSSVCDPRHYEIKKAADRIEESIKKTNWAERKTLSIIEQLKRSQRLRKLKKNESAEDIQVETEKHYLYHRIDGKVLENAHKSSRRTSKLHSRSAKSSEFESECSDFPNGDMYSSSPRIDYGSETSRMSHYKKNEDRRDGDGKSRPTPPRKPLRLSLHKARSAHSLMNGSESETPSRPASEATRSGEHEPHGKRPVKRTHAADKGARERPRAEPGARATPRPARKLLNGLSAAAPAADHLYPDHAPARANGHKWC